MLISQKHGFVFFCMPKCASNSIESMLKPHCEIHLSGSPRVRHTTVREFRAHIRPYLAEVGGLQTLETICLVREPVSWLDSWYRFRARHQLRGDGHAHSTSHLSFEQFMHAFLSRPRPPFAELQSQHDFVRDESGAVGVDRLFAYDDLAGVVEFFRAKTGRRLQIRTLNVSPSRVYSSHVIERFDALKRRLAHLWPDSMPKLVSPPVRPELPPDLYGELRAAIPEDFALYENLT